MNQFATWGDALSASFQNAWYNLVAYLPKILGGLIVFIIGWAIAAALSRAVKAVLDRLKVDAALERVGFREFVRNSKFSVSNAIAWLVKWFIILVTLISVSDALGLPQITTFLNQIVLYIPNLVAAIAILALGIAGANIARGLVERAATASRLGSASGLLGNVARWAILVFAAMAALVQLGVSSSLVTTAFGGLVGMLALAGGLAFGLGGRDKAARWLERLDKG